MIMRRSVALCSAVFCMALASSSGRGDNEKVALPTPAQVGTLIAALGSPDHEMRAVAADQLIAAGDSARPALCRAMPGASPEAASRILFVLLHTHWIHDDDPDPVKHQMTSYADGDAEYRRSVVDELGLPAPKNLLLRIIRNDTCSAVRWEAAATLSRALDDDSDPVCREIESAIEDRPMAVEVDYPRPAQNSALLAIAGWVCRDNDPDRAQKLMDQAVEIEVAAPTAFSGQADFVIRWLADRAIAGHKYSRVAQLLRDQADRWPWIERGIADPVANLFAVHAEFGPFPGFEDDVLNYRGYFGHAEVAFSLGQWLDRQHRPLLAAAANAIAVAEGGTSLMSHYATGVFLADHNWDTLANRELNLCLKLPGGQVLGVYAQLSRVAADRDDDLGAAVNLEMGLEKMSPEEAAAGQNEKADVWTPAEGWAQVQWHYLRAARTSHDLTATKQRVDNLLEMDQRLHVLRKDPGMAADIVPALQDLDRRPEADRIFTDAYNALAAQVAAGPMKPMPKNNLAWLCACSGRHLDEAIRTATEAVAMVPEDAECLDTLAAAYFRTGNIAKALEIETQALDVKPDDVYIGRQVKLYKAAAEKH